MYLARRDNLFLSLRGFDLKVHFFFFEVKVARTPQIGLRGIESCLPELRMRVREDVRHIASGQDFLRVEVGFLR